MRLLNEGGKCCLFFPDSVFPCPLSITPPPTEWSDPSADCLSPVGVYNLYLGIVKEIKPEMAVTREEPPSVYQGHAFIVEAAIALGGKGAKQGITVRGFFVALMAVCVSTTVSHRATTHQQCFRYANRIPLLYNEGADVVTRVAKELRWGDYKINAKEDRIGVFVSIVSTKIPFKVGNCWMRGGGGSTRVCLTNPMTGRRQGVCERRD